MAVYDFKKMKAKLIKDLDDDRYQHTIGVMYTCASLAMAYGCDIERAQCAGLLHDCAKCISNKKKLKMCEDNGIALTQIEKDHPYLIHAKLGAYIAREKYGVTDPEILSAIQYHTTGKPQMSLLEKIVYIADFIEPLRNKAPGLFEIRRLAFQDLDECMYAILHSTLDYLGDNPQDVDMTSLKAYNYYMAIHNQRQHK